MLYCCGGREKGGKEHTGAEEALMSCGVTETDTPAAGMLEIADMPELLPPSGQLEESPLGSACDVEDLQGEFKDRLSHDSPQRRLGQRAPKLGQIGRSKRVVIEDEDLDDVLNNNNNNNNNGAICASQQCAILSLHVVLKCWSHS